MSDTTTIVDPKDLPFSRDQLETINSKAVMNNCFTPDHVYIDLTLMKDIPLGVAFADTIQHRGETHFNILQTEIMKILMDYQTRTYDTVDPYLGPLGYTDESIAQLLEENLSHDQVFMIAPTSKFFNMLIGHTVRNQNHSGPANKFERKPVGKQQYILEPVQITYYFNTYPLTLSDALMRQLAPELGEAFGVNIKFINKDPMLFDEGDWNSWIKKIDCFYLNSYGRFARSPTMFEKQGELEFIGKYFFVRKRHETCVMEAMRQEDFNQQIALMTAKIDMFCDFHWLQGNDTRLSEEEVESTLDPTDLPDDTGTDT